MIGHFPRDAKDLLAIIPTGRANALSSRVITRLTGLSENKIQEIVAELRKSKKPIAAACTPPCGYYIPATDAEAADYDRWLSERIESYCVMRSCIRSSYRYPPVGSQGKLELETA